MADGTYGSPFYQGNMAPADGSAPTNKFATNINRKKTRKWVDAKKINYDGSGWGDDDDDEDDGGADEEPLPPMPLPSAAAAAAAQRALPSQHPPASRNLPSSLAPGGNNGGGAGGNPRARGSPSPGRMPLNAQTPQQQPPPPLQQQPPWRQASPGPANMPPPRASSQMRATSPGGPGAVTSPRSGSQPPSGTYSPWREGRSESPLGPRGQSPAGAGPGGAGGPGGPGGLGGPRGPRNMSPATNGGGAGGPAAPRGNFVRPSDIYKRAVTSNETSPARAAEEAAERGRNDQPVAPATSATDSLPPPAAAAAAPFIPPTDNSINNTTTISSSVTPPQPQHKPRGSVDSTTSAAEDAANDRRYSTSPKLPDLARFSTFSPELLFGGGTAGFLAADAPPMPSIPNSPAVGAFPVEGAASTSAAAAPPSTLATVAEGVGSTSRNASPFSTSSGESALAPAPAPIRDSAATATTAITASSNDDVVSTAAGGARESADSTPSSVDVPATATRAAPAAPAADSRKSSLGDTTSVDANAGADPQAQPTLAPSTYSADQTIAPLNPHRLSSMVPFMPPPVTTPMGPRDMQRTATLGSVDTPTSTTDSPVKESDVLREEIIRTLSPVKMTHSGESMEGAVAAAANQQEDHDKSATAASASADEGAAVVPAQEQQQTRSDHARTLTRESSYLQDVYDDYWTPDDASANETYTASDPPPPVPPLAGTGSGPASAVGATELDSSVGAPGAPGAAGAAAAAAGAAAAAAVGAAAYASASGSSPSTDNYAIPQPSASEPRQPVAPAPSQSPGPSVDLVPGAFPSSNTPTPAAAQSAFAKPPGLRRRFSWEAEPEPEPQQSVAAAAPAPAPAPAAAMVHGVLSLPSQQHHLQQQHAAAAAAAAEARTQSPPPAAAALQMSSPVSAHTAPETASDNISPHPDTNTSVSAISTSTVAPELVSPSPISDAVAGAGAGAVAASATSPTVEKKDQPAADSPARPQTQAPVRSMLDVGDDPAPRPQSQQQQQQPDNRISTVESVQSASSIPLPASQPLSPSQMQPLAQPYAQGIPPAATPSIQIYQPVPVHAANPALFGSANDGNAQFLTLRQCMAFDTHHERMAKLAETRHEYAVADSGLSSWLQSMTSVPEYSRAAYAPLFDNQASGAGPHGASSVSTSRPVAAVAATISRVPHHVHVGVPSGTQISNKSKEIFSVATGKAGKGLLALRKKGFHKKSNN